MFHSRRNRKHDTRCETTLILIVFEAVGEMTQFIHGCLGLIAFSLSQFSSVVFYYTVLAVHAETRVTGPDGQIPQFDLWAWKQLHPTTQG